MDWKVKVKFGKPFTGNLSLKWRSFALQSTIYFYFLLFIGFLFILANFPAYLHRRFSLRENYNNAPLIVSFRIAYNLLVFKRRHVTTGLRFYIWRI